LIEKALKNKLWYNAKSYESDYDRPETQGVDKSIVSKFVSRLFDVYQERKEPGVTNTPGEMRYGKI